jgi:hypothetical protein
LEIIMDINVTPFESTRAYREEVLRDFKAGSIIIYYPILADGLPDPVRSILYYGKTMIQFSGGPQITIETPLAAKSVEEAIELYVPTIAGEVKKFIEAQQTNAVRSALTTPPRPGSLDLSKVRR